MRRRLKSCSICANNASSRAMRNPFHCSPGICWGLHWWPTPWTGWSNRSPYLRKVLIAIPVLMVVTAVAGTTFVRVRSDLAQQRADIASGWTEVEQALEERAGLIGDLADTGRKLAPLQAEVLKQVAES